ncbi:tenascin-X-like [Acipenser ruthenus]|uniref:tenascin-X-like n=1 Tax=Acipenser ruthenus TaxID=7906 RepID=UPI002741E7C6|nr:tenascin-X-like [Acipenser ruthenus]
MDEIPHSFKVTYSNSVKDNTLSTTAPSNSTLISKLRPGIHYSFTVTTVLENGTQGTPVSAAVFTKPTPPGKIKIDSVGSDSVSLSWRSPAGMDEIPHSFKVTYLSSVEDNPLSITASSNSTVLSDLIPGREYTFTVTTELVNGIQSTPVSTSACTRTSEMSPEKSVPGEGARETELQVEMKKTQVSQITHFPEDTREVPSSERTLDTTPIIPNPQDQDKPEGPADTSPVTSTGQRIQSMPASRFLCTKPSPPKEIKIDSVGSNFVSLSWGRPAGMDEIPHSFKVTYSSSVKDNTLSITAPSNSTLISKLRPGIHYSFTVTTVLENGTQGTPVSAAVFTKPTPPGKIKIDSVGSDSVSLSWRSPAGLDEIPHSFKVTYLSSVEDNPLSITAPSNSTVLSNLIPGREYTFTVTTELENGIQRTSEMPSEKSVPGERAREAELQVEMKKTQVSQITHFAEDTREVPSTERTLDATPIIPNPQDQDKPQGPADTTPATSTGQGIQSMPASRFLCTKPSPPGEIKIDSVGSNSVSLSWGSPAGMDEIPHSFKITCSSSVDDKSLSITAPSNSTLISELRPGREYSFTVTTLLENETQSTPVSAAVCTKPTPPGKIKIDSVGSDSVSLSWRSPPGLDEIPHSFKVTYLSSVEDNPLSITAPSNSTVLSDLIPGREYTFTVTTELVNGIQSTPVSTSACTRTSEMPSEKSVPGEGAQEAELQVEMKKTQISQITHFAEDTREVPSSERTLDATPIIPNPQDQDKPQGPADTSPVTSTDQGIQSMPASRFPCTKPSPPGEIKIDSVGSNSVSLSWGSPAGMDKIPHSFIITYSSSVKDNTLSITARTNSTLISKLRPGREYSFTVTTLLENGTQSTPVSAAVCTKPTPPGKIKIDSVGSDSVSLSWRSPAGMDEIPHSFKVTYLSSIEDNPLSITAPSNSTVLSDLIPGREYTFTVTTELVNGIQSTPVSTSACTRTSEMPSEKSVPGERAQEAKLQVEMKKTQVSQITHFAEDTREVPSSERTLDATPIIPNPQDQDKPQGPADTSPATSTGQGIQSMPASRFLCTKPSPPGEIKIDSVGSNSVSLSWGSPAGMDKIPHSFKITYSSSVDDKSLSITAPSNSTLISKLRPGREYSFTVTTLLENETQSTPVSAAVCTKPTPPGEIKIDSVGSDSVSLSWRSPAGMDEIPHSFKVTYLSSVEDNPLSITAPSNSTVLSNLIPGREYTFTVTTELVNGIQSTPVSTSACTRTSEMSPEKGVPGEGARETELQVEMKKTQVSQITHFSEDTREVPSSERTLDTTPIIPNPQDQDKPEGPADTSPVTSTGQRIQSMPASRFLCTEPSPPGEIKIDSVGSNSVSLSWGSPAGMEEIPHSFKVTYSNSVKDNTLSITAPSNSTLISKLRPGIHYSFTVTTVLENGTQGTPVSAAVFTKPSPPGKIKIDSVGSDSVSLSWRSPPGLDEIPHSFKVTYLSSVEDNPLSITAPSNSTVLSDLISGREYTFTVTTELVNGIQSTPVSTSACTRTSEKSVPGEKAQEAELQVEMKKTQISQITHFAEDTREVPSSERTLDATPITPNPEDQDKPQGPADTSPVTSTDQGIQSMPASRFPCTKPSPPGEIKIDSVGSNSVSLSWGSPAGMDKIPHSFIITYSSSVKDNTLSITARTNSTLISKLRPGREYSFTVTTLLENGTQSMPVSAAVCTKPTPPGKIKIDSVGSDSVSLSWRSPPGLDEIPHSFKVSYLSSVEDNPLSITAPSNSTVVSDLRPGREYSFTVTTELVNGIQSMSVSTSLCTKTHIEDLLCRLGLKNYFPGKITLSTVLEIGRESITDEPIQSLNKLPWCFLKRLMMVNVTARSTKCSAAEADTDTALQDLDSVLELIGSNDGQDTNIINPLDLLAALFLCSNSFLQQEMMSKMSMCQFAVPLLLPDCSTNQCTLMLWAMRDIVKKFRPSSLADSKGFVEDSIVSTAMPMISFVRMGDCSLSKSQILNQVLSNPQQYHDVFIHRNMESGNVPRRIANGLVEICWYLPCGKNNLDIFPEPVAVVNLRGDVLSFQKQFSILCQTSSAVFIFFDSIAESECNLLSSAGNIKAQLFLVANFPNKTEKNINSLKGLASKLKLSGSHFLFKKQQTNDAEFMTKLRLIMNDIMENCQHKTTIEDMSTVAHELGIRVDEDCTECQNAKKSAAEITSRINDVVRYKEDQLPLQGKLWKELAKIEKEECRLQKTGDQPIEEYKASLQSEKQKLRQQQSSYDLSEAMQCFIAAISTESKEERSYFLKWMRINLDVTARNKLSGLRVEYKEKCCKLSENKEIIAALDRQISNSSLGMEHFMREMGQLYEAACSLPPNNAFRLQFQDLPSLGADLLLDGFPLELVDGDASNIPLRWVSDVLKELHRKSQHKSRLLVVTVLGVQSTGKSTLLNTMFGVQFAVSSGRCTRGAFMLLIRVKEDLKEELNCDFILVIDTEGLKSPELAQLEDSYEHDNELATLVVGLSDITIINIAMENSTEMKDILQIVVHAFLRMDKVGKKPKCHFVHQNVGDVSAHDKNMRDRKMLLEQLNEMTQAASRMEKQDIDRKFTDIMEYDPEKNNWYIPGLWHGNPPMAPVNTGYSETVYQFKKSLIEDLKNANKQKPPAPVTEFLEWVGSLWKAVKYENFIFSFRNSLVAEAYNNLCVEYGKWEWDFQKHMYNWLETAKTKISNTKSQSSNLDEFLNRLQDELESQENITLDKLTKYYESKDGRVNLVESYRATFEMSIKTLRIEIKNSVTNKLTAAIDFQNGMKKVHDVNEKHKAILEEKVLQLLGVCRERNEDLSEEQLKKEFEKMWDETARRLDLKGLEKRDIVLDVFNQLRKQLDRHGGGVKMVINQASDLTKYGVTSFTVNDKYFERCWFKKNITDVIGITVQKFKKEEATDIAQCVITESSQFVSDRKHTTTDYHETYTRELLEMIDGKLKEIKKLNAQFEVDLKLHICGFAAREFQQMHEDFIKFNSPPKHLEKSRPQYCADFIDLYREKHQSQKKAEEFTERCLKPAVREYVNKALGIDIVDAMLTGADSVKYSTRSYFQHSILKQLLKDNKCKNYVSYIRNYNNFVKKWIFDCILEFFKFNGLSGLELKRLEAITEKIQAAVKRAENEGTSTRNIKTISGFVENVCSILSSDIVISTDDLGLKLIQDKASVKEFIGHLQYYLKQMKTSLSAEFPQRCDIQKKLINLPFKPQHELFKRVFGCGKLCPFCKVPCEAGGKDHKEHHASVHRPQGLGRWTYFVSEKLCVDLCSTDVHSECTFQNSDTEWEPHPYKDYRRFYPDWNIPPDPSIEASDYWKYVLTTFNEEFAEEYKAKPADIPAEWKKITKEQALKSINELFNMK